MLEKSGKLECIVDLSYYDDSFAALVAKINVEKFGGDLNKKSPNIIDDHECVNLKA